MANYLFDQQQSIADLQAYFKKEKPSIDSFGSTVNQTFEAFVFAAVIERYRMEGFKTSIHNPKVGALQPFRLKFSTRGAPKNYSYVRVEKENEVYQIRHQLRITTASQQTKRVFNANICCDIAVIEDINLELYKTDDAVPNASLILFGEVKHMAAFAELVASFIGLTYELKPCRLKRRRTKKFVHPPLSCFLYVSGLVNPTAKGIIETIRHRKYDIDIYSFDSSMN